MEKINVPSYSSGHCLLPSFPIIKPANGRLYQVGEPLEATYGSAETPIGLVTVTAVKHIVMSKLPETFCQQMTAKSRPYLTAILQRQFGIGENSPMQVLIVRYTERYLQAQQKLLERWWQKQVESTPGYSSFKFKSEA